MMDDANYAYCVIGIGTADHLINLWIADPHINTNEDATVGLYVVTLDEEGNFIKSSVTEDQRKCLYSNGCDKYISFKNKPWMILI